MTIVFDMQGTLYPKTEELIRQEEFMCGDTALNPSNFFDPLSQLEVELFKSLRAKKFIATGGSKIWTVNALTHLGIIHLFEAKSILTEFNKGIRSNWEYLANETESKDTMVWFIGDAIEFDMKPAKGVGMKTIWIDVNLLPETYAEVDHVCHSLKEALELLNLVQQQLNFH